MFTGITAHAGSLVTAIVVLTGAAILYAGAAAADPNQDDQFVALLDKEGIPALEGVPSLIDTAHKVCHALDAGTPVNAVVDALVNYAYSVDQTDRGRLARTETRFVRAAVGAYCPYDQGKIASIMANLAPGSNGPTHRVAAYMHNAVNSGSDLREPLLAAWQEPTVLASLIGVLPGGVPPPNPPQIPVPPPPTGQTLTPPLPIAAPPPPKRPPPPPQQVEPAPQQPPPPQQVEPAPQQPPPPPQEPPPPPQEPPPPPQQPPPPPQQPPPPRPQQPPPPPQQVEPSTTPPGPPGRVRLAP
jgi:Protein of unknown function (DUF732)